MIKLKNEAFEVLWVARYDYTPGWVVSNHAHDYYQIIAVLDGEGEFSFNGVCSEITPKQLFFLCPGMIHGLINKSNQKIKTLDIKFQIHDSEVRQLISKFGINILSLESAAIDKLEKIREEGLNKKPFYKDLIHTYLGEIVFLVLRQMHEQKGEEEYQPMKGTVLDSGNAFTSKVESFLEDHFSQKLSLDEMALYTGYNKNYFCEVFKKAFGISPMKYLYKFRISKAKELIAYSDYNLKKIAEMTGFESVHHFTRMFGNLEAITPGQWREKERQGVRKDIFIKDDFENKIYNSKIESEL